MRKRSITIHAETVQEFLEKSKELQRVTPIRRTIIRKEPRQSRVSSGNIFKRRKPKYSFHTLESIQEAEELMEKDFMFMMNINERPQEIKPSPTTYSLLDDPKEADELLYSNSGAQNVIIFGVPKDEKVKVLCSLFKNNCPTINQPNPSLDYYTGKFSQGNGVDDLKVWIPDSFLGVENYTPSECGNDTFFLFITQMTAIHCEDLKNSYCRSRRKLEIFLAS